MAKKGDDFQAAIALIIFGGMLVYGGLRRMRRKRIVEDTATIDIASAPQGMVEIQGFAWPGPETSLTLGGQKATFHRLVLEKYVKRNKSSSWVKQWEQNFTRPFYVLDHTGIVMVNPESAEVEAKCDTWEWGSLPGGYRERATTLNIDVSGFPPSAGFFGALSSRFRFRETAILIGNPVYLHGTLKAGKQEACLPASLPLQRFRQFLARNGGRKVSANLGFDLNKDGRVSDDEAEQGVNQIAESGFTGKRFNEQPPLPGAAPNENRLFGSVESCDERTLYIADCHQEHLLARIGRGNILMIVGGACLIGVGAFILAAKFLN